MLLLLFLSAGAVDAQNVRVAGSAGAESHFTPANEQSLLNPRNVAGIPAQTFLLDGTTLINASSKGDVWKGALRLRAESVDAAEHRGEISEAFVQFQATERLTIAAGRRIEQWGTGYAWNPSGFIGPVKSPTDPNDRRNASVGRDMLKVSLYAAGADFAIHALRGGETAFRASRLFGPTEVSVYAHHDKELRSGMSISRVCGAALELHAELATRKVLLGGHYTFANGTNIVAELYHDDDALSTDEWQSFRAEAAEASGADSLRSLNRRYSALQMSRDHLFVRAAKSWDDSRFDGEAIVIASLRDGSSIVRLALTHRISSYLSLYVMDTEFLGGEASELGPMQIERLTTVGTRLHF
jgi:hypothetical protein